MATKSDEPTTFLPGIEPLVPTLVNPARASPRPASSKSSSIRDPFEDLFSSPSPPSEPLFITPKAKRAPAPSSLPPPAPASAASPSSPSDDFGTFVSVPPSLDPLAQPASFSPVAETNPKAPLGAFGQEAIQRTEQNGKRVMDELLSGDLVFASTSTSTSTSTPDEMPPIGEEKREKEDRTADLKAEEGPPSPPPSPLSGPLSASSRNVRAAPVPPIPRTPSFPPPTNSRRTSSYASFTATLPRKWTSLLSSSLPSPPLASEAVVSSPPAQFTVPPGTSSVDVLAHTATAASPPATIAPLATPKRPPIHLTHTNPFASQPYIPPSGAPGFGGDRNWDKGFENDGAPLAISSGPSIKLAGRSEMTTPVLPVELANIIRKSLPPLARLAQTWNLLYSMDQHGISLSTFYTRSSAAPPRSGALLVIKDADDSLFGAWIGDGIRLGKGTHYGSGDSFLWKGLDDPNRIKTFKWTGKNNYVALCEPTFISIGGGYDGKTGLYLDSTLLDGTSAHCLTFDNDVLCAASPEQQGKTVRFEVFGVEVWSVEGG